jgi:peptidyl-prolyl cis-trans isomerase C
MAAAADRVLIDALIRKEVVNGITEDAAKARFQKQQAGKQPEPEVHARHILVATEAEAKSIIDQLNKGGDFEEIAKAKSTDKGSQQSGGDLGWFKKSDMVKEFADAAFNLKKDEMTETPVKTQFGYHVIKLEDRRQAPPPSFEELSDQLRDELARETVSGFLDQLRSTAKIEKFNIDGSKAEPQAAKPATPGTPAPAAPPPATPPK